MWTVDATLAQLAKVQLSGQGTADTLALTGGGTLGANLSGFGAIDLGTGTWRLKAATAPQTGALVLAAGATLQASGHLAGIVEGTGRLAIAAQTTLDLTAGFDFGGVIAGGAALQFSAASTLLAGAKISVGSIVQNANLTLGSGKSLAPGSISYTMLTTGAKMSIALSGASGAKFTNSGVLTAAGKGSSAIDIALNNTGTVQADAGTFSLLGAITNNGALAAQGGTFIAATKVGGTGSLDIGSASTLWLQAGAAAGQTIAFEDPTGQLDLSDPGAMLAQITGLAGTDLIDLVNIHATGLSYANDTLTVLDKKAVVARLDIPGNFTTASFALARDGHGGSLISLADPAAVPALVHPPR